MTINEYIRVESDRFVKTLLSATEVTEGSEKIIRSLKTYLSVFSVHSVANLDF